MDKVKHYQDLLVAYLQEYAATLGFVREEGRVYSGLVNSTNRFNK